MLIALNFESQYFEKFSIVEEYILRFDILIHYLITKRDIIRVKVNIVIDEKSEKVIKTNKQTTNG